MSASTARFAPEPERYEFYSGPIHMYEIERRDFFRILGAGVAIFAVSARSVCAQETAPTHGFHMEDPPEEISAWLHIGEDGGVTVFTGKVEVGQNIRTSLAQSVADELRVPFACVRLVMADTLLTPFDMGTVGSRTTPTMAPQLRRVAEAARDLLVAEAAKWWDVPADTLVATDAHVKDPASGKSVSYAELARGKVLAKQIPTADPITPRAEWTVAGQSVPKVDARDFVTGKHKYSPDLHRPGMLYGKVLRPPSFGATLASFDQASAQAMSDVTVVRDGDFVGAVATTGQQAKAALDLVRVEWKESPQISGADLFAYLKQNAATSDDDRAKMASGSVSEGLAKAAYRLEASYTVAYIAHCPLEPRAAVAEWGTDGKLTVWTGSQRPFAVRDELAWALHVPESRVRVIVPDTGSAYGGKHTGDAALEAARLARAAGKPVKVVWTREEEFTWAYFRPAGLIEVKSGVMADGVLSAWEFHNYNSGASAIESPYTVANLHVEFHPVKGPLRSGSYRGLAATANFFARETHMDSAACAAGLEPLEFRLKNLSDERLRAVLQAAAKSFGWPGKKSENGQGFGIAGGTEKGSYVATCAEVRADQKSGSVRVVRLATAFECGAIVNPDGLRNQVIGANIQGLGGAMFEAVEFANGRILNPHFASYRVPRFRDIPDIQAVLLDRRDIASAGAGETPIMAVAPAIGNAIYDATGTRLRSIPLVPRGLKG